MNDSLYKHLPKALVYFLPGYLKLDIFPLHLISVIPTLPSKWGKVPCLTRDLRKMHLEIMSKRDDKRISPKPFLISWFLTFAD